MLWSLLDKLTLFQSPTIGLVLPACRLLSPEESTAFETSDAGELIVHVHQNLLAAASPTIRKALATEPPLNSFVLEGVDDWTLRRFLEWLYRGVYTPPITTPHDTLLTITQKLAHARILVLATTLNITPLQAYARALFHSTDWPIRTVPQWPPGRCKSIVYLIRYCFDNIGTEFLSKRKRLPSPESNISNAEALMEELVMDLKSKGIALQLDRGCCPNEATGWQELCDMNKFTRAMFLVPLRRRINGETMERTADFEKEGLEAETQREP